MTDRPIFFSAPMIRALHEGRKTQTRRILKPQPWLSRTEIWHWEPGGKRKWCDWLDGPPYIPITDALAMNNLPCVIGDQLWVKTHRFMSRTDSPITLEVTRLKVERVQDISDEDAIAEGAMSKPNCCGYGNNSDGWSMNWPEKEPERGYRDVALGTAKYAFGNFWNSIHGHGAWDKNPWIYAIIFKVMK